MNSLQEAIRCVDRIQRELRISCLLIGGFAVNEHGYTRNTLDIDFMIAISTLPSVKTLLRNEGFSQISEYENVTFFSKPDDELRLDFLIADENTLSRLEANAQPCTLHGVSLRIPSLRDLLAMKIFALKGNFERRKSKDLPDIAFLTILNHLDFAEDILPLCDRYGNPAIAEKIQAELRSLQS
ncbi:MAG: hypothetical protein ACO3N7_09560 [Kiritimatiellia bacterium]